ncbi:hypothetical protein EVAR_73649_1 [Eumeta japonica]|uniref:Uncharacterized protein n=1 Tax=Eumeta variegata TaxID=151549 RepID=A0A4C1TFT6_EUMVA|nr:hypothetical protein EVAR_73649_1 [Eumeta japonica]
MYQQRDMGHIYDFVNDKQIRPPTPVTQAPSPTSLILSEEKTSTPTKPNHKVVIYFGDSLAFRNKSSSMDVNKDFRDGTKVLSAATLSASTELQAANMQPQNEVVNEPLQNDELTPYIEIIENGVINIKIEGSFQVASALVERVTKPSQAVVGIPKDTSDDEGSEDGVVTNEACDWSFVQEWRARPIGNIRPEVISQQNNATPFSYTAGLPMQASNHPSANILPINTAAQQNSSASSGRIQNPAVATPAPRIPKELAQRPLLPTSAGGCNMTATPINNSSNSSTFLENSHTKLNTSATSNCSNITKPIPQRAIAGPARLTVQSTRYQHSPNTSTKPNHSTRTHHHEFRALERVQECHSSSDENRSSGHASMSDTGGHGSSSPGGVALGPLPEDRLAAGVTNRSTRSRTTANHPRSRHRANPVKAPWSGNGLEDIKLAIQQLTMRSQTSTSTYSSISAGSESSEPVRRLGRYASLKPSIQTLPMLTNSYGWTLTIV